jgi:bifunctional non-homologous end joining protein LigD
MESILTHLDKIFWPEEGYTKGDLIHYYQSVAPYLLPHLKDRPESLLRCPNGIKGQKFFQKNVDHKIPDWLPTHVVKHKEEAITYLLIQDVDSLTFAINLGCIDLNPFNSRIKSLENPDYLILDLDPEDIKFDAVVETALAIHDLLSEQSIPSYCKTSGATGIHIYIPLGAKYSYEQCKQFAELLAHLSHEQVPHITSLERSPSKRQKRVYIDFLQNNFGQTLASPYSVRPRSGAPVSTPLDWSEVKLGLDPLDFNLSNTLKRLKKRGDLFAPVLKKGIDMMKCIKNLEK